MSESDSRTITLKVGKPTSADGLHAMATGGIPFPRGALASPDQIEVTDAAGTSLPCQGSVLSKYEDGSIQWLLLSFLAPVSTEPPPDTPFAYLVPRSGECQFRFGQGVKSADFPGAMGVEEDEERIVVTSRRMRLVVPKGRFGMFESLEMEGREMVAAGDENDLLVVSPEGEEFRASLDPTYKAVVEEQGPLRSVIKMTGRHTSLSGRTLLDYVVRVHVYAESTSLAIEHQFINCEEPEEGAEVAAISAVLSLALDGEVKRLVRHTDVGYNRKTRYVEFPWRADVHISYDWCTLAHPSVVGDSWDRYPYDIRTLCPLGMVEAWLGVGDGTAGLMTEIEGAMANYPKGIVSEGNRVAWGLWPTWAGLLHLNQGMAKTHRIVLTFYADSASTEKREKRIGACMSPVPMTVPFSWIRSTGVFGLEHVLEPCGEEHPRVEFLLDVNFSKSMPGPTGWRHGWPVGMLDYGDAVDEHYNVSYERHSFGLRGEIWNNNEYDFIHSAMIQFFRTGSAERLHDAKIASKHLMDVDFIHYSPNPLRHHGVPHHSVNHTSGTVVPSHMFTEGLLEYYCATGDKEALSVAVAMGDHLLRTWEDRLWMADHSAREVGWPLISLATLYEVTREQCFLEGAQRAIQHFVKREEETGGYYNTGNDMFTNLIGWKKMHGFTGDDWLRDFMIEQADKEMAWRYAFGSPRFLEVLEYVHHLTGDRKYLEFGWRSLMRQMDMDRYWSQPRSHKAIGSRYRGQVHFFRLLKEAGLLHRFDYPGLDEEGPVPF